MHIASPKIRRLAPLTRNKATLGTKTTRGMRSDLGGNRATRKSIVARQL